MSSDPFRLADVQFFVNSHRLRESDATLYKIRWSNFMYLELNDQKNAVCGKSIGHGRHGH